MIWNRDAETLAPDRRRVLQLERLRDRLRWAASRVPLYRERLADVGVGAESLRGLEDLARLPFLHKTDLREHYPFGLFAVDRRDLVRVHASSGTRGKPTVVGYTRADLEIWREVMARALAGAGAEPGDLLHIAYGYGLFTGGLGFHDGAEHMGLTVVPASSGNTLRHVMLIRDFRPDGLACTPSFALHLGDTLLREGVEPGALGLRYGLFGAEPWTEAMRRAIESRLGLVAVDFYGLSEVVGPGVAAECAEARDGLHIQEDHFLPEIVDGDGQPLPAGAEGELVLTTLTKEALPAIRYRTGDLTRLDPTPCPCGRTTVRMARVKGRSDDMLVFRGVNVYPSEVEAALLDLPGLAPHYLLVVDRAGGFPRLEVHVEAQVADPTAWDPETEEIRALRTRVQARLRAVLAMAPEVVVAAPGSLPRSEGKAVRVVDRAAP